jgi:hypothetical protein
LQRAVSSILTLRGQGGSDPVIVADSGDRVDAIGDAGGRCLRHGIHGHGSMKLQCRSCAAMAKEKLRPILFFDLAQRFLLLTILSRHLGSFAPRRRPGFS